MMLLSSYFPVIRTSPECGSQQRFWTKSLCLPGAPALLSQDHLLDGFVVIRHHSVLWLFYLSITSFLLPNGCSKK